jgi:hypothetical protein
MFFRLLTMLGWVDQGHRRAAVSARHQFCADHPGESVAWTEIAANEPGCFVVGVHYGHKRPKECQLYTVDKETFQATPKTKT